jgi:predicted MPP superfamily phosphohydrolase
MSKFLRVLVTVTGLVHVPFLLAAAEGLRRLGAPNAWWLAGVVSLGGFGLFMARARAGLYDKRHPMWFVWLVDVPYFIHWCACIWTLLPTLIAALVLPLVQAARGESPQLPTGFIMWTYAVGFVLAAYGIVVRRRWFVVQELDVRVAGLDPKLDGYRIAQLSDLHIGTTTPRAWGERWARAANERKPDMAVVTGDLLTSGTEFYDDVAGVVSTLSARDGVYVSMGNHDYFGDGESFVARLRATGATVLRNEGRLLEREGAKLYLAAIDDTWTRRDDMDAALSGRVEGVPTVLLAHEPERFRDAAKRGVELVLSGHTHGGQVAVPFLYKWLNLSRLTHHYTLGIYKKGRSTLHVHPGLGTTGPPIRLGIAPAVVLLTLRAA